MDLWICLRLSANCVASEEESWLSCDMDSEASMAFSVLVFIPLFRKTLFSDLLIFLRRSVKGVAKEEESRSEIFLLLVTGVETGRCFWRCTSGVVGGFLCEVVRCSDRGWQLMITKYSTRRCMEIASSNSGSTDILRLSLVDDVVVFPILLPVELFLELEDCGNKGVSGTGVVVAGGAVTVTTSTMMMVLRCVAVVSSILYDVFQHSTFNIQPSSPWEVGTKRWGSCWAEN